MCLINEQFFGVMCAVEPLYKGQVSLVERLSSPEVPLYRYSVAICMQIQLAAPLELSNYVS